MFLHSLRTIGSVIITNQCIFVSAAVLAIIIILKSRGFNSAIPGT